MFSLKGDPFNLKYLPNYDAFQWFYRVPQSKFEANKSVIEYKFYPSAGLKTKI